MKYLKQMCRFLVVILIVVAFSLVSVVSPARAETLSATDQAAADSTLESLEDQAAAAGIGVRTVNGVKVFHTGDGVDLEIVQLCNGGGDAVKDQYGEIVSLRSQLQWELHLPISTEVYQDIPADSAQRSMSALAPVTITPRKCYSQQDASSTGWATVHVGYLAKMPIVYNPPYNDTMYNVGCMVTCAAMETATYNIYLPNLNYSTGLPSGTSSLSDPANLNYWLNQHSGFDGSNMRFEAMAGLSSVYGVWQSKYHWTGNYLDIYTTAQNMIAGTFTTAARPSLPIVLMNKTGVSEHHCAWYGTDGTTTASHNLIVQPTLHPVSDTTLECTFEPIGNKGYSPVNGQSLMVVACWRK